MLIEQEGAGSAIDQEEDDGVIEVEDDSIEEYHGQSNGDPDPYDEIEDEAVRNRLKGLRAKERRDKRALKDPVQKAEPVQKVEADAANPSNYATKDDLKRLATQEAKKMIAPEVKELWDELTAIPLGGFDPMDAESIATNMMKRYQLYRVDHPDAPDVAKDFQISHTSSQTGGAPQKVAPKADSKPLPGYKEPVTPDQWYPPAAK